VQFISAGARDVATARGVKVVLYLEYEFGNRDFAPIAARIKEADPDFLWIGAIGLDGNLLLDALHTIGYRPRGQYHLFPYPFVESQAAGSLNAWLLLEAAVNAARSLDDKAVAAWLKANRVDTPFGRLSFEGENNYGAEHTKVKQNQNGRWVIVWPREFAAPGATVVYPAP